MKKVGVYNLGALETVPAMCNEHHDLDDERRCTISFAPPQSRMQAELIQPELVKGEEQVEGMGKSMDRWVKPPEEELKRGGLLP